MSIQVIKKANQNNIEIFFTADAWIKLTSLVEAITTECAVHGTVIRQDSTFIIDDIFIYPQFVLPAFVEINEPKYVPWLDSLPNDTFNRMRFQCHSHVNMGATPSGTDTSTYQSFIENVTDFYIFMVLNKKNDYSIFLYDLKENLIYDKQEITTGLILENGQLVAEWIFEHKDKMSAKLTIPAAQKNVYTYSPNTMLDDDMPWYEGGRQLTRDERFERMAEYTDENRPKKLKKGKKATT